MHNDSCYFFNNGPGRFYLDKHFVSCGSSEPGGFAQCCQPGTYCLSDGICKFDTDPDLVPKKNSLYYAGLCTDPSGKAAVCRNECFTSDTYYYINWLGDSWQCCYGSENGEGDCTDPRGEKFNAPAPAQLTTSTFLVNPSVAASVLSTAVPVPISIQGVTNSAALKSYVTSAIAEGHTPMWFHSMPTAVQTYYVANSILDLSSSSPSGRPTSASHGPSQNPGQNGSNDGNNNLGVKVGVPVAVVLGLLILAGLGLFFFWRRRKVKQRQESTKRKDNDKAFGDDDIYQKEVVNAELPPTPAPVYSPAEWRSRSDRKSALNQAAHPAFSPVELDSPLGPSELADTSSIHSVRAELPGSTTPAKP